jgi:hypothetical protein
MSLFADICRDSHASDDDIEFDDAAKTWTIKAAWGADAIPGIPDKEMALAIARAICAAWDEGSAQAGYS